MQLSLERILGLLTAIGAPGIGPVRALVKILANAAQCAATGVANDWFD